MARSLLSAAARFLLIHAPSNSNNGMGQKQRLQGQQQRQIYQAQRQEGIDPNARETITRNAAGCISRANPKGVGDQENDEKGPLQSLLPHLVWRYLELGTRGRVCLAALRKVARELSGSGGKGTAGRDNGLPEGVAGVSTASEKLESAAAKLEESLKIGESSTNES